MTFLVRSVLFLTCLLFFQPSYCTPFPDTLKGIDQIYLINLDHRNDRLASVQAMLAPYGIYPSRFSAVYGKNIPMKTLCDIALICTPDMAKKWWMTTPADDGTLSYTLLNDKTAPQHVFCEWMTIGAVGCAMSHFSILKEAYEHNYETIWVLEDDILVDKDPRLLPELIVKLDQITGGNWDLLYTDRDDLSPDTDLSKKWWWRPDLAPEGDLRHSEREIISDDFIRIGSRIRTHSMIIRRSGIKKLLDHLQKNRLFLPIDHEIAFASGISLYMLSYPVVTYNPGADTDIQKPNPLPAVDHTRQWTNYKRKILDNASSFPGWCTREKAHCLMDFVQRHQPLLCVEIGAFGGSTSYPIASALKFAKKGHLYAIDAWSNPEAVSGFAADDPNYPWWETVDLILVKDTFINELSQKKLMPWCSVIHATSRQAAAEFADNSIDMLYVDGNFSSSGSLEDLVTYFPKVKPGGHIWLNDANILSKRPTVAFLMERATFIPQESLRNWCALFQKATPD